MMLTRKCWSLQVIPSKTSKCSFVVNGGEGGIRTRDTLLTYTHFPGVLFKPLRHLSDNSLILNKSNMAETDYPLMPRQRVSR